MWYTEDVPPYKIMVSLREPGSRTRKQTKTVILMATRTTWELIHRLNTVPKFNIKYDGANIELYSSQEIEPTLRDSKGDALLSR